MEGCAERLNGKLNFDMYSKAIKIIFSRCVQNDGFVSNGELVYSLAELQDDHLLCIVEDWNHTQSIIIIFL